MVSSKFVLFSEFKNGAMRRIFRWSCENCFESIAGVLRLAWPLVNLLCLNSFLNSFWGSQGVVNIFYIIYVNLLMSA